MTLTHNANQLCYNLERLVFGANNIPVLQYWMVACYVELHYHHHNDRTNQLIAVLAHTASTDENFEALEQWCYDLKVTEIVDIVFFSKLIGNLDEELFD